MDKKCIIILNENLEKGLAANIAAVLGMSLGSKFPELTGPPVRTANMTNIPGITTIPIPILRASTEEISGVFANETEVDFKVIFGKAAMNTKSYPEYVKLMSELTDSDQEIHGILLLGSKKSINKVSGNLPLYK